MFDFHGTRLLFLERLFGSLDDGCVVVGDGSHDLDDGVQRGVDKRDGGVLQFAKNKK